LPIGCGLSKSAVPLESLSRPENIEFTLDSGFESLAQQVVIWARSSQGFESGDDDIISNEFRRQEAQEEQAIGQSVEHSHELLRWHG